MPVVAGVMAISDFQKAPEMVRELSKYCNLLVLRFDALNGDKKLFRECVDAVPDNTPVYEIRSREKWNRWNWREDLLRRLDVVKPDYVLFIDSDEQYGPGFAEDLEAFIKSGMDYMMFDYEMRTNDEREVIKYPKARHCKGYRWVPKLGYRPYRGYAKPTWPFSAQPRLFHAKSKIQHFCFYTKEMELTKKLHL